MDLLQQFVVNFVGGVLPQGGTLANVNPVEGGRIDALVSHGVAALVKRAGNPLVVGLYEVARPFIDGALVGSCGPAVFAPKVKRVATKRTSAVAKRRASGPGGKKKKTEWTKGGIEILDAEFVDVPR